MLLLKRNRWALGKYARKPFQGELKIDKYSSFRKLARAIRRGRVPEERQFVIDEAEKTARRRLGVYHYRRPPC